jgi:hypothetical protein
MDSGEFEASIDIKDNYYLYYYLDKRWKEPKFFKRIVKFNWKKDSFEEFLLQNDNDLNKIDDVKTVRVNKKY